MIKDIMMNRKFVVFNVSEIDDINYDEVIERSANFLRLSLDGEKTFVKYEGDMPDSVDSLTTKEDVMSYSEIRELLATEDWNANGSIAE
tara:strand:+ start:58 stop:324 length:267 start_codon:yes stop_codon:yes gene_type:complete